MWASKTWVLPSSSNVITSPLNSMSWAMPSKFFGAEVRPENVIGETLRPATDWGPIHDAAFVERLRRRITAQGDPPPTDYESFISDPLAVWIEANIGLQREDGTQRLIRAILQLAEIKLGAVPKGLEQRLTAAAPAVQDQVLVALGAAVDRAAATAALAIGEEILAEVAQS